MGKELVWEITVGKRREFLTLTLQDSAALAGSSSNMGRKAQRYRDNMKKDIVGKTFCVTMAMKMTGK